MLSTTKIDDWAETISGPLERLMSLSSLCPSDRRTIQEALHQQGPIERRQAAALFHANRVMQDQDDGWIELYLATLTGFFLEYHDNKFVFPDRLEVLLHGWLGEDVAIVNRGERRLTLRILLRAAAVPERFERRILQAIAQNLLHEEERWSDAGERSPGIVDGLDLHLIRRLTRRAESQCSQVISASMIDFMLMVDRNAHAFSDAQAWRALLVESLIHHLCPETVPGYAGKPLPTAQLMSGLTPLLDQGYTSDEARLLSHDVLMAARTFPLKRP